MTPKLRSLLKLVGAICIVGTGALVPLYLAPESVPDAVLLDAGAIRDSVAAEGLCAFICEGDGGRRYVTKRIRGRFFGTGVNGGFVPTQRHLVPPGCRPFTLDRVTYQGESFPVFACKNAATLTLTAGVNEADEQPDCACGRTVDGGYTRAADNCEQELPDGGWAPAPWGLHMREGQWRGASCMRKPCVEEGGTSSWPSECGPESL